MNTNNPTATVDTTVETAEAATAKPERKARTARTATVAPKGDATELDKAIAAVERRAVLGGGRVNFGADKVRAAWAGVFPSVELSSALIGAAKAGRIVLTGADYMTALTPDKAASLKAKSEARTASKKATGDAIRAELERAMFTL